MWAPATWSVWAPAAWRVPVRVRVRALAQVQALVRALVPAPVQVQGLVAVAWLEQVLVARWLDPAQEPVEVRHLHRWSSSRESRNLLRLHRWGEEPGRYQRLR